MLTVLPHPAESSRTYRVLLHYFTPSLQLFGAGLLFTASDPIYAADTMVYHQTPPQPAAQKLEHIGKKLLFQIFSKDSIQVMSFNLAWISFSTMLPRRTVVYPRRLQLLFRVQLRISLRMLSSSQPKVPTPSARPGATGLPAGKAIFRPLVQKSLLRLCINCSVEQNPPREITNARHCMHAALSHKAACRPLSPEV